MKHAYLIIAHSDYKQLELLVDMLDDKRNTIFIHIDKKSSIPTIKSNISKVFLLKDRVDVRWGDISQVECELLLFAESLRIGGFDYYHLLSGVDFPIKSQDYIDHFFIKNYGKEFIGFNNVNIDEKRINRYHFFTKYYKSHTLIKRLIYPIRFISENCINILFPRKLIDCYKGANWVSITEKFCQYLVDNRDYILSRFKYTCCPDEHYKQSIIAKSPFKDMIYDNNSEFGGCMREIDWERGTPYTWGGI